MDGKKCIIQHTEFMVENSHSETVKEMQYSIEKDCKYENWWPSKVGNWWKKCKNVKNMVFCIVNLNKAMSNYCEILLFIIKTEHGGLETKRFYRLKKVCLDL